MMRRAVEWFLGSVLVYVFVAACAASKGVDDLVEMASGGIKAIIGGSDSMAGALGSGASQSPDGGKAETGSGATQGSGATNQGSGATQGEGASGGMAIMNPVPEADAAEDGTRIVNLYRTTPDGLKTPAGYEFWDKELDLKCTFALAEDGKERCVPPFESSVGSYFGDSGCSVPVGFSSKGLCPKYGYAGTAPTTCGQGTAYRYTFYQIGAKTSTVYQKSGDTCVEVAPSTHETADFYSVAKIAPTTFAEGSVVQGG